MGNSFTQQQKKPDKKAKKGKGLFKDDFSSGDVLGSGAFSQVVLASPANGHVVEGTDATKFAIKIIKKADLTDADVVGLRQEIDIMQEIRHRHVIRLYDVYDEPAHYYLVTELVAGGELFERICEKKKYTELEARTCVRTILSTLAYLHERGIAHRDLKPENLLLTSKDDDGDIKVADFGFAKHIENAQDPDHALDTQCGTPGYVAPEILQHRNYGTLVDVWSIGVIVYIMLGGYPPFYSENQAELFRKIKKGAYEFHEKYWGHISNDAKDLIRSMLVVNPDRRPSCKVLLKHHWLELGDEHLSGRDISESLKEMKAWNVKRKFRGAVNATIAAKRLSHLVAGDGGATGIGHHALEQSDAAASE